MKLNKKITTHAKQRLRHRFDYRSGSMTSLFSKALRGGISPHNMTDGAIKSYLLGKLGKRNVKIKLYQNIVFVYKNKHLITAYELPKKYKNVNK